MGHPNLLSSICVVWVLVVFVKSDELQRRYELSAPVNAMEVFSPPPPPPPPPPPVSPPPPPPSPEYLSPPPPIRHIPPPPRPKSSNGTAKKTRHKKNAHPPPHREEARRAHEKSYQSDKKKRAKQIGYWFVGAVGVLQIAVIGFLVYKRREISKMTDRHESSS